MLELRDDREQHDERGCENEERLGGVGRASDDLCQGGVVLKELAGLIGGLAHGEPPHDNADESTRPCPAGEAATAFDHYDSRSHEPQLHTHVVISNKVKTVQDGKWRTLDGRPMHRAVVAISEMYNAVLADNLARSLGLDWETRDRGRDRNPT